MKKRWALLLASVLLAVLLAAGVALAAEITCEPSTFDNPCLGTQEDDTLRGIDDANDFIKGLGGIDTLYGRGFRDRLEGGRGNDTLRGEGGRDFLFGEEEGRITYRGNDRLLGGPFDDELNGGPGNDRVLGGPGDDDIIGYATGLGTNRDYAYGGDGDDHLSGGSGERYGEGGNDIMWANEGDSLLYGGPGNDTMSGNTIGPPDVGYTYVLNGGPGEDSFGVGIFSGAPGSEQPPDDITYQAVDGEHDTISCNNLKNETVRVDPLDTFVEAPGGQEEFGRQYCDSLTIVE